MVSLGCTGLVTYATLFHNNTTRSLQSVTIWMAVAIAIAIVTDVGFVCMEVYGAAAQKMPEMDV